jgi:hypothetical protein
MPSHFETELQHSKRQLRFSIPREVARLIGVEKSKKKLNLRIYHQRRLIFETSKLLTSGTEITGAQMKAKGLSAGDRIKVQVSACDDCLHGPEAEASPK